jgi:hypothetical protein
MDVDSSPIEEDSGGEDEEVGGEMQRLKQRECSDWPVACEGGGASCLCHVTCSVQSDATVNAVLVVLCR